MHFEELEVWKQARLLTAEVYGISKLGDFAKDHTFCHQIRKASVSVLANIAEGYERGGNQEFASVPLRGQRILR